MNWTHKVKVLHQTDNRVTVREAPSYGVGVFFLVIEAVSVVSFAVEKHSGAANWVILAVVCGWMTFLAVHGFIDSTFTVSRDDATLTVRRSLICIETEREYPLSQIDGISLRRTLKHGEGLRLELKSQKPQSLTISLHCQALNKIQLALDNSVRTFGKHSHLSKASR